MCPVPSDKSEEKTYAPERPPWLCFKQRPVCLRTPFSRPQPLPFLLGQDPGHTPETRLREMGSSTDRDPSVGVPEPEPDVSPLPFLTTVEGGGELEDPHLYVSVDLGGTRGASKPSSRDEVRGARISARNRASSQVRACDRIL